MLISIIQDFIHTIRYYLFTCLIIMITCWVIVPKKFKIKKQINISLNFNETHYIPPKSFQVKPALIEYEKHILQVDNFTVTYLRRPGPKQSVVILPFMFGHGQSYCVRRLIQQLQDYDVYVLLQRGCGEDEIDPNTTLTNEYVDTQDLLELCKTIIKQKAILIGLSMGAMKAVWFAQNNSQFISKLLLLWCPFDPLQPVLFPQQKQQRIGEPILVWAIKNKQFLLKNNVSEQQYQNLVDKTTMMKWDSVQALRMQLDVEEYYRFININNKISTLRCPTLFVSSAQDGITGSYLPKKDVLANPNVGLVQVNHGDHLQADTYDGLDYVSRIGVFWLLKDE